MVIEAAWKPYSVRESGSANVTSRRSSMRPRNTAGDETLAGRRSLDGRARSVAAGRPATRFAYERYLFKLVAQVERSRPDADVREVTVNDCRAFLDQWIDGSPSTVASIHSALNGLFQWLYLEGEIEANPMVRIDRPRR